MSVVVLYETQDLNASEVMDVDVGSERQSVDILCDLKIYMYQK